MIKHVVFFKFKPDASAADRQSALDELRSLPAKIDQIHEFEIGEDLVRSPRSWDAVLIATYDDMESLQAYQRHDAHVPVVQMMQSLCEAIGAVDFETD